MTIQERIEGDASLNDCGDEQPTIFARATAEGEGAIGIVRLSGTRAIGTIGRLFVKPNGKPRKKWKSYKAHHGFLIEPASGRRLDEVLVLFLPAKQSLTGEDVVEIQCHGGPSVMRAILGLLSREGLQPAQPGEFTRRGFLNGRLSLDQAEAILDLVKARSEEAALATIETLSGRLRTRIRELREKALALLGEAVAQIEFGEEGELGLDEESLESRGNDLKAALEKLGAGQERARLLREGIRIVLAGSPNTGKSSLMNAVLCCDRSIVTEVPGTTRDTIEETLCYRGLSFVFVDTAGLQESSDLVETLGMERTRRALEGADLILLLLDLTRPITEREVELALELARRKRPVVIVPNKGDVACVQIEDELAKLEWPAGHTIPATAPISALTGAGIEGLLGRLHELVTSQLIPPSREPLVWNERHWSCLEKAKAALEGFLEGLNQRLPLDVGLIDLDEMTRQLGLITGEVVTDDILEEIFSKFCIGK
ncbi:MAG: tRNA uridine-5-carboxymethylaminomethyl(34) synthesis GTPase MnmE [Candidatus Riflebacteria bacterium]|nr:tRNA uridine-5-carboxymethylaminomethyl(34) synthesis GTPase MnmE [Candidatus Riflebacteria bacterium]